MFKKIKLSKTSGAVLVLFIIGALFPTGMLYWWMHRTSTAIPTVAVIGDSISDEYQADDARGGTFARSTFNWVEQLARTHQVSFGPYGNWGGFRRRGYEYNFSRSGATTTAFLDSDGPEKVRDLIKDGKIRYLYYQLGENDLAWYNTQFADIYAGKITPVAQKDLVDRMFSTIDQVDPDHRTQVLIATIPDWSENPLAVSQYPNPTGRDSVRRALVRTNDEIKLRAKERGIAIVDVEQFEMQLRLQPDQGVSLDSCGDEPHHGRLADCVHYGTMISGLYANLWLESAKTGFGTK